MVGRHVLLLWKMIGEKRRGVMTTVAVATQVGEV
jgi:hypothetical protein